MDGVGWPSGKCPLMKPEWATVIAGLGAAVVSGAVAILSAWLTAKRASREADASREENQRNRENSLLAQVVPRQLGAIETIWLHLYRLEISGHLSDGDLQNIIRALIWVTEPVRDACLQIVVKLGEENEGVVSAEELRNARQRLLTLARTARLAELMGKDDSHGRRQ